MHAVRNLPKDVFGTGFRNSVESRSTITAIAFAVVDHDSEDVAPVI
jgi:hypothetical protein